MTWTWEKVHFWFMDESLIYEQNFVTLWFEFWVWSHILVFFFFFFRKYFCSPIRNTVFRLSYLKNKPKVLFKNNYAPCPKWKKKTKLLSNKKFWSEEQNFSRWINFPFCFLKNNVNFLLTQLKYVFFTLKWKYSVLL